MSLPLFKSKAGGARPGSGRKPLSYAARKGFQVNVHLDAAGYGAVAAIAHENGDTLAATIRSLVTAQLAKR